MSRPTAIVLLNVLSMSRLLFAILFVLYEDVPLRVGLLVLAGGSDVLDGWLARSRGLTTRAGALIDPLADRAFVLTALLTLTLEGTVQGWELALLVLRDLATGAAWVGTRLIPLFQRVAFQARAYGKAVTFLQFLALLIGLLEPGLLAPVAVLGGALSVLALVDYARFVWRERAA